MKLQSIDPSQGKEEHKPTLQAVCVQSGIPWHQIAKNVWPNVPPGITYAIVAAGIDVTPDIANHVLQTVNRLSGQAIKLEQVSGWVEIKS